MRIRNKNIPIRVTEKELEIIDRKAAKAKLSRTDFLVTAALGKEITLMEDLKPVLAELRRSGKKCKVPKSFQFGNKKYTEKQPLRSSNMLNNFVNVYAFFMRVEAKTCSAKSRS